jgi:hypothetical protein
MLAHQHGYNPMIYNNEDGTISLKLCTIKPFSYSLDIKNCMSIISDGLDELIAFSDEIFSTKLNEAKATLQNDSA